MSLVNVALEELGAKIKTFSSSADITQSASNILNDVQDSLWTTAQGIPQFVIISLEELEIQYRNIQQVWFNLWHDYDTNPKIIELWVSQTPSQQFKKWTYFQLSQKKGRQCFVINSLPSDFIFLKFSIVETYGANQTYLNQIKLMAKQIQNKKQLNLQDLQSNLQQLIEMDKKISRSREKQNKFDKKIRESRSSKRSNIYYHQESANNPSSSGYNDYQLSQAFHNGQHAQDNTHQTNSSQFSKKFKAHQISQQNDQNQSDESQINNNVALIAISNHIAKMQDNMDEIQRKVEVLDMKLTVSHQNLEKSLLGKVEKMIDHKLSKVQSSKQFLSHSRTNQKQYVQQIPLNKYANQVKTINNQFYRSKKHSDNIQNTHTKRLKYDELSHQTYKGDLTTKPTEGQKIKTSKSIANLNNEKEFQQDYQDKKGQSKSKRDKDEYVKSLLEKLNQKLKQREVKIYKLKMKDQKKKQHQTQTQTFNKRTQAQKSHKRKPYEYY